MRRHGLRLPDPEDLYWIFWRDACQTRVDEHTLEGAGLSINASLGWCAGQDAEGNPIYFLGKGTSGEAEALTLPSGWVIEAVPILTEE